MTTNSHSSSKDLKLQTQRSQSLRRLHLWLMALNNSAFEDYGGFFICLTIPHAWCFWNLSAQFVPGHINSLPFRNEDDRNSLALECSREPTWHIWYEDKFRA